VPSKLRSIIFQDLSKLESKFTQFFGRIHQTMNRFDILSSSLPHHPLLNKKKKTIVILLAMIAWKESIIQKTRYIFGFHWMTNTYLKSGVC